MRPYCDDVNDRQIRQSVVPDLPVVSSRARLDKMLNSWCLLGPTWMNDRMRRSVRLRVAYGSFLKEMERNGLRAEPVASIFKTVQKTRINRSGSLSDFTFAVAGKILPGNSFQMCKRVYLNDRTVCPVR